MRPFLTAEWRHLVMLNYEVDPRLLADLAPAGTELDTHEGRHFVSLVGFMFLRTRVLGVPIPFHVNFEELNLRFYVRREGPEGPRRGVAFIKELVPRAAIAWVARATYNENYRATPMRHHIARAGDGIEVSYDFRGPGGRWNQIAVTARGEPQPLVEGSEEQFIAEHYWGYARQRDGGTVEYRVEHPPWRAWRAERALFDCDAAALYGSPLGEILDGARTPSSAFLAEGSEVAVLRGVPLR